MKLVILNYPEGQIEMLPSENNPEDPESGTRELPFGQGTLIEAEDFKIEANRKWFRLAPGKVVRLKSAYKVEYVDHLCDDSGKVTEVHVNYFENSKSGSDTSGIKAKGTLHWVESTTRLMLKYVFMIGCLQIPTPMVTKRSLTWNSSIPSRFRF